MNCSATSDKWQCVDGFYWFGRYFRQLLDGLVVFFNSKPGNQYNVLSLDKVDVAPGT